MSFLQNMDLLKTKFSIFVHDGRHWIWLDDLLQFLSTHPAEVNRPSKVERHLNGYRQTDRITTIIDRKAIPVISLLKYVFHRMDNSKPCEEVAQLLEKAFVSGVLNIESSPKGLTEDTDDVNPPIYDLYKKIAKSKIGGQALQMLDRATEIFDDDILYLVHVHQQHFSNSEWSKIKLFEIHFSHIWMDKNASIIQTNNAKRTYWNKYSHSAELKEELLKDAYAAMHRREARKKKSAFDKEAAILSGRKHRPIKVEQDLTVALQAYYPSIAIVKVVDSDESVAENTLHVYVEVSADDNVLMSTDIIQRKLASKHQTSASIFFFAKGTLDTYNQDGKIARFAFRDDVILGRMKDKLIKLCLPETNVQVELEDENDDGSVCQSCFPDDNH